MNDLMISGTLMPAEDLVSCVTVVPSPEGFVSELQCLTPHTTRVNGFNARNEESKPTKTRQTRFSTILL